MINFICDKCREPLTQYKEEQKNWYCDICGVIYVITAEESNLYIQNYNEPGNLDVIPSNSGSWWIGKYVFHEKHRWTILWGGRAKVISDGLANQIQDGGTLTLASKTILKSFYIKAIKPNIIQEENEHIANWISTNNILLTSNRIPKYIYVKPVPLIYPPKQWRQT